VQPPAQGALTGEQSKAELQRLTILTSPVQ